MGVELAQFFRRMGSRVTIVESHDRLLARSDAAAGAMLREAFESEGIDVHVETQAVHVSKNNGRLRIELTSGDTVEASRLLVATGRRANVDGFGLEQLGLEMSERGSRVDDRLRVGDGVWAIGDVAGVALLTHVGTYQARVAAAVAGQEVSADYRAIPAVVFTDPQIGTVGTTEGEGLVTVIRDLESSLAA